MVEVVRGQVDRRAATRFNGCDELGGECGLARSTDPVDRHPKRVTHLPRGKVVGDATDDLVSPRATHP